MNRLPALLLLLALPVASQDTGIAQPIIPPGSIILSAENQMSIQEYVNTLAALLSLQNDMILRLKSTHGCI